MTERLEKPPRVSVKAVVFRDDTVLVIKLLDADGVFFEFPGGGQERGETLHEALVREVKEETGFDVEPLDLFFVRDYIGANHEFAATSSHVHQTELYFHARLRNDVASVPHVLDTDQIGVEWLPLDRLETQRLYPLALRKSVAQRQTGRLYVGDVN